MILKCYHLVLKSTIITFTFTLLQMSENDRCSQICRFDQKAVDLAASSRDSAGQARGESNGCGALLDNNFLRSLNPL